MKKFLLRVFALVLVVMVGLTGCSATSAAALSGNYRQDTLTLIETLRGAIELPDDSPDKAFAQSEAKQQINDFISRYRRDTSLLKLSSFTTMRTALNSLAGHYTSYPNRPVPEKLKVRLEQEFRRVESALQREA